MDTLTTILDSVWFKDDLNFSHKKGGSERGSGEVGEEGG